MLDVLSAATLLFLIMDPLGNLPIYMSVLKTIEPKRRTWVIFRELSIALVILFVFLFSGQAMLDFLRKQSETAQWVTSVCTGSALLAKAGILDGHRATSNKQVFAIASMQSDKVEWVEAARWVEDGKFFTSSGVSAGMDMTLAIIQKLWGNEAAEMAASYTEYSWHRDADNDPFADELNVLAKQLGMV